MSELTHGEVDNFSKELDTLINQPEDNTLTGEEIDQEFEKLKNLTRTIRRRT